MKSLQSASLNIDAETQGFSEQELQILARFGKKLTFAGPGLKIFDQGAQAHKIYFLAEGVVRISRLLLDGSRHVVAFKWAGGFFGLQEEGVFSNHADTLTACTIYEFESNKLSHFLLSHPSLQQKILKRAIYSISSNYRQIIIVGRLGTQRALAAFFLDCASQSAFFDRQTNTLTLPMTRYDIADYLGTAAESVTRAVTKLEADGLLHRRSARTLTLNLQGLRHLANIE